MGKKPKIVLALPISIRSTINNDGYVITDADDCEHFFYLNEKGNMDYDGSCCPIKRGPKIAGRDRG